MQLARQGSDANYRLQFVAQGLRIELDSECMDDAAFLKTAQPFRNTCREKFDLQSQFLQRSSRVLDQNLKDAFVYLLQH